METKSRQRVAYKHSTRSWNDYPSRLHWDLSNKVLKCERSSPSAHHEQSEREKRSLRAVLKATALGTEKIYERWSTHALVDTQTDKKPGTTRKVGGLEANLQSVVKKFCLRIQQIPQRFRLDYSELPNLSPFTHSPRIRIKSLCKLMVKEWIELLHANDSADPGLTKSLTGVKRQHPVGVWIKQYADRRLTYVVGLASLARSFPFANIYIVLATTVTLR